MPPATHRAISKLIDSFVKDVVLRRNLAAGWALVGPDMRFGTTRKAWVRGTGVTAQEFPAVGKDFGNAWDLQTLDSPGHAQLTVNLRSAGRNAEVIAAPTVVLKEHGRWVVDIYYEAGIFRTGAGHKGSCAKSSCAVTGVNDFGPGSASSFFDLQRHKSLWLWVGIGGVGGVLAATLASLMLYTRLRDRRAMRAYEAAVGRR